MMTNYVEGLDIKFLGDRNDNKNAFASSLIEKCRMFLCLLDMGAMALETMVTTANAP